MPDDKNVIDPGDPTQKGQGTGDPAEYEKQIAELRRENASWRTKLRDSERELETAVARSTKPIDNPDVAALASRMDSLEKNITQNLTKSAVQTELEKRGVKADPSWIKVEKYESATTAVDKFLTEYPHLQSARADETVIAPKTTQKPMSTIKPNTNVQKSKVTDIAAIKKDPIARSKLRQHYMGLVGGENR